MSNNDYNDRYTMHELAKKALQIADKIGLPIIDSDDYYTDKRIGEEYSYDELRITYYNKSQIISIYMGKTEVLCYDFNSQDFRYINGKWQELIDIIYEQVPNIIQMRKLEAANTKAKIEELLALQDYFKYYIECDREKKDICQIINSKLASHGIAIVKQKHYSSIRNLCTGDTELTQDGYTFQVIIQETEVAKFMGSKFEPLPNPKYYVEHFKQGSWIDIFKNIIIEAKEIEKKFISQKIDDSATSLIRKLTSH